MPKEAVFTMKLEAELREDFMAEAAGEDRPASQVMRELMRGYIEQRRKAREYDGYLQRKVEEVFALHSPVFSSWEQRPRLFDFSSTRPFTGNSALMYQNITLMPLVSRHGHCNHICIIIYDVTDAATGKQGLQDYAAVNKC